MAFVQWRALIGPRYNHYAWWELDRDLLDNLDIHSTIAGLGGMSEGTTSVQLADASAFPDAGGVFISGTFSKAGEYCQYTGKESNTLTGLVREPAWANNHEGIHNFLDNVHFWFPLPDDDGTLRYSWQMDETLSAVTWEGSIRGYKARHWAIRNNHLIAIQTRNDPDATWRLNLLGVIVDPNFRDTGQDRTAEWSIKIRSLESIWGTQDVRGVRVGLWNAAAKSSATATQSLVLASDERSSGDYTAAAPELGADQAIDGDANTLWIAERFMGTEMAYTFPNSDGRNNDGLKFNQIYINPPNDAPPGSRWIELILLTGQFAGFTLYSATGTDNDAAWQLSGSSVSNDGGLIILCEDQTIFEQLNPHAQPDEIRENWDFFQHFDPASGEMWLRLGAINAWRSRVAWGTSDRSIQHEDAPGESYGTRVTAPGPGETMRYIHDWTGSSNSWEFWETGKVRSAGYKITTSPDEWIMVTLPGLGLVLGQDITATVPGNGEYLRLSDAAGGPSTAGLAGAGVLQIGSERIEFASKDESGVFLAASGARGADGTTAAPHNRGDPVYAVEGGVVTDAQMIRQVGWTRNSGSSVPSDFTVRFSPHLNPRSPDTQGWDADYSVIAGESDYDQDTWTHDFENSSRVKALVIQIEKMTEDPGRPRLNEITAILDPEYYLSSLWLDNGVEVDDVAKAVLVQAGMPADAISTAFTLPVVDDIETAADKAWVVVADLMEFTSGRVLVERDGKVSMFPDDFWSATPEHSHTWDDTNTAGVEQVYRNDLNISQVQLKWRSPDGSEGGVEAYPATEGVTGSPLETEDFVYADATAAQAAARKQYYLKHFPYTAVIEAAADTPEIRIMRPGQVHRLQWTFNILDGVTERLYLVTAVDHWIEDGSWFVTIYGQQIERVIGF